MKRYSILKKCIWIATILWMCMIFYFSHQPGDVSRVESGRVLQRMNLIDDNEIDSTDDYRVLGLQRIIRKWAHKVVYFFLGALLVLSIINTRFTSIRTYILSYALGTLYGATDELHQMFVPGRGPLLSDVFIDSVSVLAGVTFIALLIELLKKSKFKPEKYI